MSGFTIRPAESEDASVVVRLFIKTRTECLPYLNWEYDEPFLITLFAGRIEEDDSFLVAEIEGEIVGFVRFTTEEIDDLYVLPSHHGKGIGHALLDMALKDAGSELRLWAFQANKQARAFYEAHGFIVEFETDGQDNMEKCPDVRYVRREMDADA